MAELFNQQRKLGIRLVADGTKMHNGLPVIGVREAAGGVLFVDNKRVLGVDIVADGPTIFNEQPVRGAVLIADARTMYNGCEVLAVFGAGSVAPTLNLSATSIDEGATGRLVGLMSVVNGSGSYTFTKTADPDGKFAVSGSNLNTAAALDYETKTSHSVTIQASNGVDTPISRTFTVQVTNAIEGTLAPTTATFDVSSPAGTVIATVTGFDVGASETIASITPNDGRLAIAGNQIVVGLSASTAGTINAVVTTTAGRTLGMAITVTAAPAYAWSNVGTLFNGGSVDGLMVDFTDTSTLFQDANGATPVTANGHPIALALDQHKWGGKTLAAYRAAQPELVVNGAFDSDLSGWSKTGTPGSIAWNAGTLELTATDGNTPYATTTLTGLTVGRWYEVTGEVVSSTAGTLRGYFVGPTPGASTIMNSGDVTTAGFNTPVRRFFKATGATAYLTLYGVAGAGNKTRFDNISVKEIDGHHLTQATAGNRPTWASATGDAAFNGTSQYLTTGDFFFTAGDNFLSAWGGPFGDATANRDVFGCASGGISAVIAQRLTTGLAFMQMGSSGAISGTSNIVGSVATVLADKNTAAAQLFVNGVQEASAPTPGNLQTAFTPFVGAVNNGGSPAAYINGRIKRVVAGQIRLQDVMTAADFHNNLIAT